MCSVSPLGYTWPQRSPSTHLSMPPSTQSPSGAPQCPQDQGNPPHPEPSQRSSHPVATCRRPFQFTRFGSSTHLSSEVEIKRDRRENVSSGLTQLCIILLTINISMILSHDEVKGNKYIKGGEDTSCSAPSCSHLCGTQHPELLTALIEPVRLHPCPPGRQELSLRSLNL